VTIGGERFHLTANADADGSLREVLLRWDKHGSVTAGLVDGYATALSIGLRHGVPLRDLVRHGIGLRFSPAGSTDDPDIPAASSITDYVARRLAIDWLPASERTALGIYTLGERIQHAPEWVAVHGSPEPDRPRAYATQN
jgi:ribonucleoside-diphosphate reductase alpha chain